MLHGFSPPEIAFLAEHEGLSVGEVLAALKEAGLASLPGGGAEILSDPIRSAVSPNKCSADAWIGVMAWPASITTAGRTKASGG